MHKLRNAYTYADDANLLSGVRVFIADHAVDEAVHHAFFSQLIPLMWTQYGADTRDALDYLFPQFLYHFVRPSKDEVRVDLCGSGLTADEADEVMGFCYQDKDVQQRMQSDALSSVVGLAKYPFFNASRINPTLVEYGLVSV